MHWAKTPARVAGIKFLEYLEQNGPSTNQQIWTALGFAERTNRTTLLADAKRHARDYLEENEQGTIKVTRAKRGTTVYVYSIATGQADIIQGLALTVTRILGDLRVSGRTLGMALAKETAGGWADSFSALDANMQELVRLARESIVLQEQAAPVATEAGIMDAEPPSRDALGLLDDTLEFDPEW